VNSSANMAGLQIMDVLPLGERKETLHRCATSANIYGDFTKEAKRAGFYGLHAAFVAKAVAR